MAVRRINGPHEKKVVAVIEELLDFARTHGVIAFQFVAEVPGRRTPLEGVVGRYRADPARLIGELAVVKSNLVQMVGSRDIP